MPMGLRQPNIFNKIRENEIRVKALLPYMRKIYYWLRRAPLFLDLSISYYMPVNEKSAAQNSIQLEEIHH